MTGQKEEKHSSGAYLEDVRIRDQFSEEKNPGLANFSGDTQQVAVAVGIAILLFSRFSSLVKLQPRSQIVEWPFTYLADEPDRHSQFSAIANRQDSQSSTLANWLPS